MNLILPIISVGSIFAWWGVAAIIVDSEYVLPSIGQTFGELLNLFGDEEFYRSLLFTLLRSFIAFSVSSAVAFSLAVIAVQRSRAERFIAPVIAIVRALPTIAIVLLLLFWTDSNVAPVIVTMLVVLPTIYTNVKNAFESVDKTTVEAGTVDGATRREGFLKIRLPQALPAVYSSLGGGLSLNLKLMVAAEVLSATANSVGYLMNTSKVYFETATMFALVIVTVVIGCAVEAAFNALSKKTGEWK